MLQNAFGQTLWGPSLSFDKNKSFTKIFKAAGNYISIAKQQNIIEYAQSNRSKQKQANQKCCKLQVFGIRRVECA